MKKQFLLPVLALAFAVTGAFASNRLADVYFPGGDSDCNETALPGAPCTPGTDALCKTPGPNGINYYYKIEGEGQCLPFEKTLQ